MRLDVRPIWIGLAASVLLHAALIRTDTFNFPLAQEAAASQALDLQLEQAPQPLPRAQPVAKRAPLAVPPKPAPTPQEEAKPQAEVPAPALAVPAEPATPAIEPEAEAAPPAAPEPALNPLPRRIDLEYRLSVGPASGRQTLVWVNDGDRYTVTSVAEATGVARMFYSGRFVQTSRGRITARGLQPEEFWDQRGDRHSSARFDAQSGTVTATPAKGAPRHFDHEGDVQDALSLFFQLALTAPPTEQQLAYTVFNGKKLRDYRYEVRGEETLATVLGELRTLHLARAGGEGRFEVWLAADRHYLPVRVLRVEESGMEGELAISAIASSE